ncbi:uncharacterized protein LOC117180802 [Belonocnema kinseyi]|uniref:uncharacterized protein LOC117180802 n=1 Tax=Belonocnema kinseyi TaxID=2817044 RepID=UPI00143D7C95|nr:uncharacterized protein LOC117180802 [Belonocnema kinseyi]
MWVRIYILCFLVMLIAVESSPSTEIQEGETELQKCKCANFDCGCCSHIEVDVAHINGTLCSDFRYLPDDIGVSLTITYNKLTIYNETFSVKNPPEICPILVEDLHIEACLRFYDVDFDKHHFSGCAEVHIAFLRVVPLARKDLGCFHIGHQNSSINSVYPSVVLLE